MFEEVEDDKGYKFFLSKSGGKKKKEHPILISIIKLIKSTYSDVRYSTYRVVVKLRKLKKELNIDCISYRIALSVIQKHKNDCDSSICPRQLADIIYDIFYASEKSGLFIDKTDFRLESAVSILTNFFWNVFDRNRSQNITIMELKLAFLILCDIEPSNAYQSIMNAHFEIVKDFNRCITKPRFEEFVNIFGKILSYLGEPIYFEPKVISDILTEAFSSSPGFNGISQDTFYNLWLSHQATKFSSYTNIFLLMIRFKKSESVVHQTECYACKKFPIIGLRYKCQKCNISLCFECFSKGFTSKRHSLGHRFYELSSCEKENSAFCAFFGKILSLFRSQSRAASINQSYDHQAENQHTKLIEDEHIELVQVDDDMDMGIRKRSGTIRSEIYNNSENLLIQQRELMDKFLSTLENLKIENEKFVKNHKNQQEHCTFINDQVEIFHKIHEELASTFNRAQSNNTIRPFASPSKSIFLPSSTPYVVKEKPKLTLANPLMLSKSINGYELNKSYVDQNADYSISDLSTFFMTKVSARKGPLITKKMIKISIDDTETDDENVKEMFKKLKDLIETSYGGNKEEIHQTMETLSEQFHHLNEPTTEE